MKQIPFTADLLTMSVMQLAMLVQPLALPHPSEEPIQVVDFGESGHVRCSRCKAYVNPFMCEREGSTRNWRIRGPL
ncbi:Protein transport protein Sec24B, variant 2 [Trifolium repens]|nr:Protein transport protein Sec24B, variant 2 [Trifolium repens]